MVAVLWAALQRSVSPQTLSHVREAKAQREGDGWGRLLPENRISKGGCVAGVCNSFARFSLRGAKC